MAGSARADGRRLRARRLPQRSLKVVLAPCTTSRAAATSPRRSLRSTDTRSPQRRRVQAALPSGSLACTVKGWRLRGLSRAGLAAVAEYRSRLKGEGQRRRLHRSHLCSRHGRRLGRRCAVVGLLRPLVRVQSRAELCMGWLSEVRSISLVSYGTCRLRAAERPCAPQALRGLRLLDACFSQTIRRPACVPWGRPMPQSAAGSTFPAQSSGVNGCGVRTDGCPAAPPLAGSSKSAFRKTPGRRLARTCFGAIVSPALRRYGRSTGRGTKSSSDVTDVWSASIPRPTIPP